MFRPSEWIGLLIQARLQARSHLGQMAARADMTQKDFTYRERFGEMTDEEVAQILESGREEFGRVS